MDAPSEDESFFPNGDSTLSDSTFVPIKTPDIESDDSSGNSLAGTKVVKFSKLAEVTQITRKVYKFT